MYILMSEVSNFIYLSSRYGIQMYYIGSKSYTVHYNTRICLIKIENTCRICQ
jgi:hypothetical protein